MEWSDNERQKLADEYTRIRYIAGELLPAVSAPVPRSPAFARVPRPLPRQEDHDRGTFRFRNRLLYLANAMVDQPIGLEETEDDVWSIWFNTVLVTTFDEHDSIITG